MASGYLTLSRTRISASSMSEVGSTVITVPSTMTGATFTSVHLSYTRLPASMTGETRYIKFNDTRNTYSDAALLTRLNNGDALIELIFQVSGTNGATAIWGDTAVAVEYIPAAKVHGTISVTGNGSCYYAVTENSITASETAHIQLALTPTTAVSTVKLWVSGATDTVETLFTFAVSAKANVQTTISREITLTGRTFTTRVQAAKLRIGFDSNTSAATATDLKLVSTRASPTVSATYSDTGGAAISYVQGKCVLHAVASCTLDTAADADIHLNELKLAIGGNTYYSGNGTFDITDTSALSGSVSAVITATDNYGVSGTNTQTLTFKAYSAPKLTALSFERYNTTSLALDDNSDRVWLNCTGSVSSVDSMNAWALKVGTVTLDSDTDGRTISHTHDTAAYTAALATNADHTLTVVLADLFESKSYTFIVPKSGGIFNIESVGVSVGKRCTGTAAKPLFQCAYDAEFDKPVAFQGTRGWVVLTLASGVSGASYGHYSGARYRVDNGRVRLEAALAYTASDNLALAEALPEAYRPAQNVYVFSPMNSKRLIRAYVGTDGVLKIEWVIDISDGSAYTSVTWCDIVLEWYV